MGFLGTVKAREGFPVLPKSQIKDNAIICQDHVKCGYQLFVGIFFDGTGNNKKYESAEANTNVTKLWDIFPTDKANAANRRYFRYYIPGVGTPFDEIGEKNGDKGGNYFGSPFGNQGQSRVEWGIIQLFNSIHQVIENEEFIKPPEVEDICQDATSLSILKNKLDELATKVKAKEKEIAVNQINLSIFGFSRGAAQARSFVNQLIKMIGGSTIAGIKIQFDFLGIFDTVASVGMADIANIGIPFFSGHWDWGQSTKLVVPELVKKCVHIVAAIEGRACFPSDLVRNGRGYSTNCDEYVMPGAHSDIGGGYVPGDLGVTSNHLPRIALQQMYYDAVRAGVPLPSQDKFDTSKFIVSADLAKSYNTYVAKTKKYTEDDIKLHLYVHYRLYLGARLFSPPKTNDRLINITNQQINFYDALLEQRANSTASSIIDHAHKTARNIVQPGGIVFDMLDKKNEAQGLDTIADVANAVDTSDTWAKSSPTTGNYEYFSEIDPDFINFFYDYVHDSGAGFVKFLSDGTFGAVSKGEWTFNGIGVVHYRSIYAGSTEDIHKQPEPYQKSKYFQMLLQQAELNLK